MNIRPWRSKMPGNYWRAIDEFFDPRYRKMVGMDDDFTPSVNTSGTEKSYEIEVAAPGLKKEDFDISIDSGVLSISSERKSVYKKENKDKGYYTREFSYFSFNRSFLLPDDIKEDQISASYEDGILRITLPKKEVKEPESTSKTIQVS